MAHLLPDRAHKILRFLSLIATWLILYNRAELFNQRLSTIYHVTKNRQARRFFTIRTHCQRDAGHQFLTADGRGLTQMGRGAGYEFHEGARILENGAGKAYSWKVIFLVLKALVEQFLPHVPLRNEPSPHR